MRFTTEVLPLLADAPGVAVEVSGDAAALPGGGRLAADRRVDQHGRRRDATGSTSASRITVEGREVPFADVFVALAAGESHLLLPDGAYFSLQKPELQALRTLIEEARALQDRRPAARCGSAGSRPGLWDELAALGVVDAPGTGVAAAGRRPAGARRGSPTPSRPPTLRAQLRPYQREGFDWLCFLWRHRLGGILADDMGLGKTLQSLALICHAEQARPGRRPFLVVAPTSVVANWAAEAARFAPDLAVVDDHRHAARAAARTSPRSSPAPTSSSPPTRCSGSTPTPTRAVDVGGPGPRRGAVRQEPPVQDLPVRAPAAGAVQAGDHRHADGEQPDGAVVAAVDHGARAVPEPDAVPRALRPADREARPTPSGWPGCGAGSSRWSSAGPRSRWPPTCRRSRSRCSRSSCDPRHRRIYQRHLQRERQKVLGLLDDVDRNRFTILRSLTLLRQLSLHPALVDAGARTARRRAKLDALVEQLRDVVDGGHRALVFSQFTGFLAQVRERLDAAGIDYCYLDGTHAATGQRSSSGSRTARRRCS